MERQTDMSPNTFKPPFIHTLCWEFYFKGIANISESRRIRREIVILFSTERSVGQCYHTTGWTSDRGQLAESLATFSERHFWRKKRKKSKLTGVAAIIYTKMYSSSYVWNLNSQRSQTRVTQYFGEETTQRTLCPRGVSRPKYLGPAPFPFPLLPPLRIRPIKYS